MFCMLTKAVLVMKFDIFKKNFIALGSFVACLSPRLTVHFMLG